MSNEELPNVLSWLYIRVETYCDITLHGHHGKIHLRASIFGRKGKGACEDKIRNNLSYNFCTLTWCSSLRWAYIKSRLISSQLYFMQRQLRYLVNKHKHVNIREYKHVNIQKNHTMAPSINIWDKCHQNEHIFWRL